MDFNVDILYNMIGINWEGNLSPEGAIYIQPHHRLNRRYLGLIPRGKSC